MVDHEEIILNVASLNLTHLSLFPLPHRSRAQILGFLGTCWSTVSISENLQCVVSERDCGSSKRGSGVSKKGTWHGEWGASLAVASRP